MWTDCLARTSSSGFQTLAKLRQGSCYCVDKSGMAIDLIGVEFSRATTHSSGHEANRMNN